MTRKSRRLLLGSIAVGGGAPVSVQSMCNTPTRNAQATLAQIESLRRAGCDITRVSVDTPADAEGLRIITAESPLPVVADIQFDGPMALAAIEAGAAGIRLNPGIIPERALLEKIARSAAERNVPIRVGANAGSLKKHEIDDRINRGLSHDDAIADALISVALRQCELLENFGVTAIKVALKSSSVPVTVRANTEFARRTDYPLHLGLTEAGTPGRGIVKSAVAIGTMLLSGIGDTMRVSLTAPPEEEVAAALRILEAAGVREARPELVSCPSCGRTEIDLFSLAGKVEALIDEWKNSGVPIRCRKIAVMGCPVNGPGEARDADIGIAGSKNGQLLLFRRGKVLGAFDAAAGFEKLRTLLVQETEKE